MCVIIFWPSMIHITVVTKVLRDKMRSVSDVERFCFRVIHIFFKKKRNIVTKKVSYDKFKKIHNTNFRSD